MGNELIRLWFQQAHFFQDSKTWNVKVLYFASHYKHQKSVWHKNWERWVLWWVHETFPTAILTASSEMFLSICRAGSRILVRGGPENKNLLKTWVFSLVIAWKLHDKKNNLEGKGAPLDPPVIETHSWLWEQFCFSDGFCKCEPKSQGSHKYRGATQFSQRNNQIKPEIWFKDICFPYSGQVGLFYPT